MPTLEAQSQRTRVALAVASLAVLLSLAAAGAALISRFDATTAARHNNAHVWHEVVCAIEKQVLANPHTPQYKKVQFVKFYDGLLVNNVKTAPCGLLTSRR